MVTCLSRASDTSSANLVPLGDCASFHSSVRQGLHSLTMDISSLEVHLCYAHSVPFPSCRMGELVSDFRCGCDTSILMYYWVVLKLDGAKNTILAYRHPFLFCIILVCSQSSAFPSNGETYTCPFFICHHRGWLWVFKLTS